MKNVFFILTLIFFQSFVLAQEICDNGIDDDGDGYVDLNDKDCICEQVYSLIPNPSFEDTLCCPQTISKISCLKSWEQGSEGTSDYFHSCGIASGSSFPIAPFPIPPTPIPEGEGFVGFFNGGFINPLSKEYVGVCLPNHSMKKDSSYTFELFVGFGIEETENSYQGISDSPFELCIYGNSDCTNLPFEGSECPLTSLTPGWMQVACVELMGENEWTKTRFEVISPEDIEALVIGPNCEETTYGDDLNYYFLDQVSLYESATAPIVTIVSGLPCLENTTLAVPDLANVNYQWFLNGIAIDDATGHAYNVPTGSDSEGFYQVMLNDSSGCFITTAFNYVLEGYPIADLGADTVLCKDDFIAIGIDNFGDDFIWNTGETTSSILAETNGLYAVTVSNECGEAYDEVYLLTDENHLNCIFEVPNAFTPDGDGINDTFGALSDCCLNSYQLQIFSRWGNNIFESTDINDKWNGRWKDKPAPSDAYVWLAVYEISHGTKTVLKKVKGELLLIR